MAFLTLYMRRQLPQAVSFFARAAKLGRACCGGAPLRRLHGSGRQRVGDKGPWGRTSGLRSSLCTSTSSQNSTRDNDAQEDITSGNVYHFRFLSWFRNGLLATGIGVIAFVQSEVGREAGYAFFILGGVCVSFGGASYVGSLFALRRLMLLSVPALLLQGTVVASVASSGSAPVSLYIGRLEVEIIHEDEEEGREDEGECRECRERREQRGYRGSQDSEDSGSKGQNK